MLGALLGAYLPPQFEGATCNAVWSSILRRSGGAVLSHMRIRGPVASGKRRTCGPTASGLKLDLRLLEHPRFNFVVPHPKQVQRTASVMFLGDRRRLMPLDLCNDADRNLDPFR